MGGINLTGLLDGGDLCHATEEEEQIATLLDRVTLIDALQDAQVRPGIQFFRARGLLLRWNRLVYHLGEEMEEKQWDEKNAYNKKYQKYIKQKLNFLLWCFNHKCWTVQVAVCICQDPENEPYLLRCMFTFSDCCCPLLTCIGNSLPGTCSTGALLK